MDAYLKAVVCKSGALCAAEGNSAEVFFAGKGSIQAVDTDMSWTVGRFFVMGQFVAKLSEMS